MLEATNISQRLTAEFGYSPNYAPIVAQKLLNCAAPIKTAFEQWWQTGELPALEIEGYTFKELICDYKQKSVAAFLTLDWLVREPELAKSSLRRGYDSVTVT